jgi:uncharacterized protein
MSVRLPILWVVVFTLTLPAGVVLSTHLARRSLENVAFKDQTIRVTGYAEHPITSDYASWSVTVLVTGETVSEGDAKLVRARGLVIEYLNKHGFPPKSIGLGPVDISTTSEINEKGHRTNTIDYYTLDQTFAIESDDVQRVSRTARDSSALISKGIHLNVGRPQFMYTKLNTLKLKMLADATENGRERALQLTSHGGGALGVLRSASQGVFQITPPNSTEVSYLGENDTSSLHKVIKAVVKLEYEIQRPR